MAWEIGAGDAVFCPSFTFAATPEVIPWTGATPVFVDILPDTYNLDPAHLEAAIEAVKAKGELRPAAVIAVDLFGQPADYPRLAEICRRHGLKLIADSAQGFGCTLNGEHPIRWADAATTSFFPAKPLGRLRRRRRGADRRRVAGRADRFPARPRQGGEPATCSGHALPHDPKYLNMRIGMNSPAGHAAGGDPDREAGRVRRGDRFSARLVASRYADGLAEPRALDRRR